MQQKAHILYTDEVPDNIDQDTEQSTRNCDEAIAIIVTILLNEYMKKYNVPIYKRSSNVLNTIYNDFGRHVEAYKSFDDDDVEAERVVDDLCAICGSTKQIKLIVYQKEVRGVLRCFAINTVGMSSAALEIVHQSPQWLQNKLIPHGIILDVTLTEKHPRRHLLFFNCSRVIHEE
jgi:hypothetical protein